MSADAVIRARISEAIKVEASAVLASMGLSVSDAMRMMMVRIAQEKKLPFAAHIPNATTIAAMREAQAMKGSRFASVEEMFASLEAPEA